MATFLLSRIVQEKSESSSSKKKAGLGLLILTMASYSLMRSGHYKIALQFYSHTKGGGLNLYKEQADGTLKRRAAIDYHPFWNSQTQKNEWRLHYHRGETKSELRKHRPYEGGW